MGKNQGVGMLDYTPHQPDEEEELLQWYRRIGLALIAGFLFPVFAPGFGGSKLVFPNIALLGKAGGFLADFSLLYPLLAGIVILLAIRRLEGMKRGAVILGTGLLPMALMLFTGTDLFAFSVRELYRSTIWIQVTILSLVGLYVGARTIQAHDNNTGRWIAAVSGVLFMVTMFQPLSSSTPLFFMLFQGMGKGAFSLTGMGLIAVAVLFVYAAFLGVLNFKPHSDAATAAGRIGQYLFYGSTAIPVILFVDLLFSSSMRGAKTMLFMILAKMVLIAGGTIGLLTLSSWDVVDHLQPVTVTGGELLNRQPDRKTRV